MARSQASITTPPTITSRYVKYVYAADGVDCPRVSARHDWAENWNGDSNAIPVPSEEAITYFTHDPDGACRMTAPDGTVYKEYYGTSWQSGLTTQSEIWTGVVRQKWTTIAWTQDNIGVSYPMNPRVTETNVYDPNNRRRSTIEYGSYAQWSLPYLVREYAANGTTEIRHTYTDYNLSQQYLDRRIIGLVSAVHTSDTVAWQTKVTYAYDIYSDEGQLQATPVTTVQHDASYDTSLTARGNLTSVSRWDTTDGNTLNDSTKALTSKVAYNTNGSPVWNKDPLTHKTSISYADSFSSGFPNLALNKPASQSSDPGWGGPASKAVDGNTSGNWVNSSVTHTNYDAQAWWKVDLGSMKSVQTVRVWNRTDCCSERLTNFNVYLLNESQAVVASVNVPGQAGNPTTVQISGSARYVKVQLSGTEYLSLAEVEVLGTDKTYAYPTQTTDADGFSSIAQYNFDFGAVTRTQGPPPAGQSQGAIQTMLYDPAGRIERVTTQNNGAYTRWVYSDYSYVSQFDTIQEGQGERYMITVWDGGGRVRAVGGSNPGSTGGYWGKFNGYDVMGRLTNSTNPAEINGGWAPVGDDAAGWIVSFQNYDWKGRPLVTTNQDGTQKYASYGGCGCAGGEVVTITDEVGRQQKVYSDVLGRQWKTEVLNWNGSVYATTTNTFNGRDQVTLARQWAGAENGGGAHQDTTMTYDGYGRLKTKHVPEQNVGIATVYSYNTDDTIASVTDARGASATYGYNNRHLVTGITYSAPQGITPTSNVTFGYDAAGNQTSMSDGLGSQSYLYNELSRLTSETRTFTGVGTFELIYAYNLAGEVKKITDSTNATINYDFDSSGRITGVTGENVLVAGVTQYASNVKHRAWGAVKQMSYGNGVQLSMTYNGRQATTRYEVNNFNSPGSMGSTYSYYDDGRTNFVGSLSDNRFDRKYVQDHAAQLKEALSGDEARGGSTADGPFKQDYTYDVWQNVTARTGRVWSTNEQESVSYTNNRRQGWQYDAIGHATLSADGTHIFDAAGRHKTFTGGSLNFSPLPELEVTQEFAGDATPTKRMDLRRTDNFETRTITTATSNTYYLRSTVLGGQAVAELDGQGNKTVGYVYLGKMQLAKQLLVTSPSNYLVHWQHTDPVTGSKFSTGAAREVFGQQEVDPLGADVTTPPDPLVFAEPRYLNPNIETFWPLEAANWTSEGESAMADYEERLGNTRDMYAAERAFARGDRATWEYILHRNPNVGIEIRITGFGVAGTRTGTAWGSEAADFLNGLIGSGTLASVGSQGERSFAHAQQNSTKNLYQTCRETALGSGDTFMGKHIPDEGMSWYLLAAGGTVNDSAFAASIVAKESDFTWRPKGDHGPAQLTKWWRENHPELIIPHSYDPFLRGTPEARDRIFTGSPANNIMTLGNIVRFQRKHHQNNEYRMAKTYYSGPGDQDAYAKEVLWRYEAYKGFFKCLGAK